MRYFHKVQKVYEYDQARVTNDKCQNKILKKPTEIKKRRASKCLWRIVCIIKKKSKLLM